MDVDSMVNTLWGGQFQRRRCLSGITVLELLVTMTTLSALASLMLPAIQATRESARDLQCQNNLRQIGVALHEFHDAHGELPAGWNPDSSGTTAFGWAAAILPQLEEPRLSRDVDLNRRVTESSHVVLTTTPETLLCPSDPAEPTFDLFAESGAHEAHAQDSRLALATLPRANFIGVFGTIDPDDVPGAMGDGTFVEGKAYRLADLSRGLSHTVVIGERTARKLPSTWLGIVMAGEDAAGRLVGHADLGPNRDDADECEFDSRHPEHVNFLWGDGHVESVAAGIDRQVYRESARRF
jgi:prepilin-type processing-associated H-X9-DG protein